MHGRLFFDLNLRRKQNHVVLFESEIDLFEFDPGRPLLVSRVLQSLFVVPALPPDVGENVESIEEQTFERSFRHPEERIA